MTKFWKYQGTGNDFIMIDDRDGRFGLGVSAIAMLCHRRFGVGADGLILIQADNDYDFRMVYYNADGHEGSMCGNGGRCAVKFAHDLGVFQSNTNFIAVDGPHTATVTGAEVCLQMIDVEQFEILNGDFFTNTGSPHVVRFETDVDKTDVYQTGKAIRYSDFWKERAGTNVNFTQVLGEKHLKVRTYERGVEDETYSCGTGVTAAALIAAREKNITSPIRINTLGGELKVSFQTKDNQLFTDILLIGPAQKVFEGAIQ